MRTVQQIEQKLLSEMALAKEKGERQTGPWPFTPAYLSYYVDWEQTMDKFREIFDIQPEDTTQEEYLKRKTK